MNGTKEVATDLLRRLVGVQLLTPTRHMPNTVLAVSPPNVLVATGRQPSGEQVPIQEVQDGLDRLLEAGEIAVHPDTLGHRSSFIGAVLLRLPGTVLVAAAPPRIRLTDADAYRLQQVRLPKVVIQPSYGGAGRANWGISLLQPVPFTEPPYVAALTPTQLADLRRMHPDGLARFWGTTRHNDANLERMSSGDVALLMGDNAVRAIGEIGVPFRNPSFADTLWTPDPDNGSWQNVYSLRTFELVEIPRTDIVSLPGFKPNDPFRAQRVLDAERSATVLEFLGIESQESAHFGAGVASLIGQASAVPRRQLDWKREEVILAMDFYVTAGGLNGAPIPGKRSAQIAQLSDLVRRLNAYPPEEQPETYRNADGVYMTLQNLRAVQTEGEHGLDGSSRMDAAVWREFVDDLPGLHAEAAAIRSRLHEGLLQPATPAPSMESVDIEQQHTETFMVTPSGEPRTAERAEQRLVLRYRDYMAAKGIKVERKKYVPAGEVRPIFCDAWVEERRALIEAKNSDSRDALRMAIGQLYDYRRFHQPVPAHLAVLLPYKPAAERLSLLQSVDVEALWPHAQGFRDSAHGALT